MQLKCAGNLCIVALYSEAAVGWSLGNVVYVALSMCTEN